MEVISLFVEYGIWHLKHRAGAAGKGFAVVASEVKSLANQTAKATEEVTLQITRIQSATNGASQSIERVSATIEEMSRIAANVTEAVQLQDAAMRQIADDTEGAANRAREAVRKAQEFVWLRPSP